MPNFRDAVQGKLQNMVASNVVDRVEERLKGRFGGDQNQDQNQNQNQNQNQDSNQNSSGLRSILKKTQTENNDNQNTESNKTNPIKAKIQANIQEQTKKTAIVLGIANIANLIIIPIYNANYAVGLTISLGINMAVAYNLHKLGVENEPKAKALVSNASSFFKQEPKTISDDLKEVLINIVRGGAMVYDSGNPSNSGSIASSD